MDSSFMATIPLDSANPFETMMQSLRAQIAAEVKSDLTGDIIDRVVRLVGQALSNMNVSATVTTPPPVVQVSVPPSTVSVNSTPALVDITNEMEMEELCSCMMRIESLLSQLIVIENSPIQRTVQRDSEGLILSITERRM